MSVFTKSLTNSKKIAITSALIMGASMLLNACSKEEHHEVSVIETAKEAEELALANAPEAEVVELPEADAAATDAAAGEATAEATTEEAAAQDADSSETELEKVDATEEAAALDESAPSSATDTTTESAN